MKTTIAILALLGQVSAIRLQNDVFGDYTGPSDFFVNSQTYAEAEAHKREINEAKTQLELHKLEQETKENFNKAEKYNKMAQQSMELEQQIKDQHEVHEVEETEAHDIKYSRKFGFEPNRFTIVNDLENVQLESQMESDPICSSAGCTQYKHKKKALGYDVDYFVPHFGTDHDINESNESLATAEKMIGHKLDFPHPKWKKPKAVAYTKSAPYDEDVVDTFKNLADSEKQLSHTWNL